MYIKNKYQLPLTILTFILCMCVMFGFMVMLPSNDSGLYKLETKTLSSTVGNVQYDNLVIVSANSSSAKLSNDKIIKLFNNLKSKLPSYWTHYHAKRDGKSDDLNTVFFKPNNELHPIGYFTNFKLVNENGNYKIKGSFIPSKEFLTSNKYKEHRRVLDYTYFNANDIELHQMFNSETVEISIFYYPSINLIDSIDFVIEGAAVDTLFYSQPKIYKDMLIVKAETRLANFTNRDIELMYEATLGLINRIIDPNTTVVSHWSHSRNHPEYIRNDNKQGQVWYPFKQRVVEEIGYFTNLRLIKGDKYYIIGDFHPNNLFLTSELFKDQRDLLNEATNDKTKRLELSIVPLGNRIISIDFVPKGAATDTLFYSVPRELNPQNYNKDLVNEELDKGNKVLLYFTADWCVYCKALEAKIRSSPQLLNILSQYKIFVVDLTRRNSILNSLLRQYGGSGIPYIVILTKKNGRVYTDVTINNKF